MKPTQEQIIAWAREAGIKKCDCDPRCHLQTGGIGCITALVALAYEAGCKNVAPPQREWQGLTDEELLDIADMAYANDLELLQTLQAKLKEKNNG